MRKENIMLTTSYHPHPTLQQRATQLAAELAIPFFCRGSMTMNQYWKQAEALLIVEENRLVLCTQTDRLSFHPNMAKLRLHNLEQKKPDHLLASLNLQAGDSLLDCTLGLAGDAITASWFLGESGVVTGLEGNPFICAITKFGLATYPEEDPNLCQAMRRIKVHNKNYVNYLADLPDDSFDVVYFDPMFDHAIAGALTLTALRSFALTEQPTENIIKEARRVARKRVVLKARKGSSLLKDLGFFHRQGGKYSHIEYGYLIKEEQS